MSIILMTALIIRFHAAWRVLDLIGRRDDIAMETS
jgi:hypothetical protein